MVGELLFHGLTFRTALHSIAQFNLCTNRTWLKLIWKEPPQGADAVELRVANSGFWQPGYEMPAANCQQCSEI